MKYAGSMRWRRLDNAAKIFPSNSNMRDSKVFRFFCELREPVEHEVLQSALDKTIRQFPFFCSVMKRGLFWYYLEDSNLRAAVRKEDMPPCLPLYYPGRRELLFRVFYYGRRINLEIYHALTDGTGAMQFLCTLVHQYLLEKHLTDFSRPLPKLDYDASQSELWDDSFQKYYVKPRTFRFSWTRNAYQLRGERLPGNRLSVVEGHMSVRELLACAHDRGATLTELLAAVLILAIHEGMRLRDKSRPVVISIPVNLRSFFPSESARNFFATILVSYDFGHQEGSLDAVLSHVKESFRENLTEERLHERINALCALEHSIAMRVVPLLLKNRVMHTANSLVGEKSTASFSNVGKVRMPGEMERYIHLFGAFTSPNKLQASSCSFQDRFVISFAGPFRYHDVERAFFRSLTKLGIEVAVAANRPVVEQEVEDVLL